MMVHLTIWFCGVRCLEPVKAVDLFVYGTLMDGDVVKMVLGRVPERRPAVLRGHCRFASKNRTYPGVQKTVQEDEA